MKPTTRQDTRRKLELLRRRLQVRRMDPSNVNKFTHYPAYNTRSSPNKNAKGKETAGRYSWKWDAARRGMFFSLCLEELHNGKRSGASFKNETWKKIAQALSAAFGETCMYTQVRNYWNVEKGFWSIANSLRSATGLGFDPFNDTISADDDWWEEAIKVIPDVKSIRNKNIVEILNYGDILFKSVTATGEHVTYPSTACGDQDITALTNGLDLNLQPLTGEEAGSCYPTSIQTPGSGSRVGSKRKSVDTGPSQGSKKRALEGQQLIGEFNMAVQSKLCNETRGAIMDRAPDVDACMPFLKEIMAFNDDLFMYGATLLESDAKYVRSFLRMETLDMKVRWLLYMQRKGIQ